MYNTTGFVSFLFRRVSGVALAIYLFIHIWVIGSVNQGAAAFDARMATVQAPLFRFFEVALLIAVVYHGFDGIRLLFVLWFNVTEYRQSLFYAMFVLFILVSIVGGVPLLLYALEGF
jgi:succinate dehydrogenase / fumarate reductase cytochrome b subunit